MAYIGQLYAVEKRARKACLYGEDLSQLRLEVSRPIGNHHHAYLPSIQSQLLPKSDAGQAVAYLLKNWLALTRYPEDGDLSIDNNRTEPLVEESRSDGL